MCRRSLWFTLLSSATCGAAILFATPGQADPGTSPTEVLLSTDAIGAGSFVRSHPDWDGRGVVIAVLDTGVDVSNPGLRATTTGEPKIIAVRDFSGQGRLPFAVPERTSVEGRPALRTERAWVTGFEPAVASTADLTTLVRLALIAEADFQGSDVQDLNANGHTDDAFAVLFVRDAPEQPWRAYVDSDGNHDLADAQPLRSFELDFHHFALKGYDPATKRAPLAFSLFMDVGGDSAELHFDDGGHGTHVAGIAAGHDIEGRSGFDGIAPGAQLMSLKIVENAQAGGATTTEAKLRALEYAAEWAKSHDRPVVINLSYGIGSEVDGDSTVDELVTRVLREHPQHLFVATSCGNSGPGLSSAGQPAASELAFTAGALLTRANARALYGADPGRDVVFAFSSRGGEVAKPNGILPGVAWSSVPAFMDSAVMAGTSMASPQAAGAHALLVSGALAAKLGVNNGMIRRALQFTGKRLDGYTPLDQGGGVVRVGAAWESLQRLARSREAQTIVGYHTSTESPTSPDGDAPAPFWRTGRYLPGDARELSIEVKPHFAGTPDADEKARFFATFSVRSTASWVKLRTTQLTLRGEHPGAIRFTLSPSAVNSKPGLHVGELIVVPEGEGLSDREAAFALPVTAIVPEMLTETSTWGLEQRDLVLEPGALTRRFIAVPTHATGLSVRAEPAKGAAGSATIHVFDPQGRRYRVHNATIEPHTNTSAHVSLSPPLLEPGVWELVFACPYSAPAPARFSASVQLYGLSPGPVEGFTVPAGGSPEAYVTVRNARDLAFLGRAYGELDGYSRAWSLDAAGDVATHAFTTDAETSEVRFDFSIDPFVYIEFTDVAIAIKDRSGHVLAKGGFGQARTVFSFWPPTPGTYTLEVRAARTKSSDQDWSLDVTERYLTRDRVGVTVTQRGQASLRLYPFAAADLDLAFSARPRQVPDGYELSGEVRFTDERGHLWLTWPLRIRP